MTQGHPLTTIAYRIRIFPLIKNLKQDIPDVTQPWYADDAGALGTFARHATYFYLLICQGLVRGYHPEPTKSILILTPEILEVEKVFGSRYIFRVCRGARYSWGYIGNDEFKHDWLRERTLTWEKNINTITKIPR